MWKKWISLTQFPLSSHHFSRRHIGLVSQPTKKEEGELLAFDDTPSSRPPSPALLSLQIKIFLLILHPPFFKKGRRGVKGRKKWRGNSLYCHQLDGSIIQRQTPTVVCKIKEFKHHAVKAWLYGYGGKAPHSLILGYRCTGVASFTFLSLSVLCPQARRLWGPQSHRVMVSFAVDGTFLSNP